MKKRYISQLTSVKTINMYRRQLISLAQNVFQFKNLPENIDKSYINKCLLNNGSIAFFNDDVLGVIALPYSSTGLKDIYGRPTSIEVRGENGYSRKLKQGEFVIMYDNNSHYPIKDDIIQIAERIALSKRVTDINISQQKTPRVWKTSAETKESVIDLLNDFESFVENVVTYDSYDVSTLEAVTSPAPYVTDKIDEHLEKEWAEFFRLIGISNLQEQKKERYIKDEINVSLGGTIASRFNRFDSRSIAIEKLIKMGIRY